MYRYAVVYSGAVIKTNEKFQMYFPDFSKVFPMEGPDDIAGVRLELEEYIKTTNKGNIPKPTSWSDTILKTKKYLRINGIDLSNYISTNKVVVGL